MSWRDIGLSAAGVFIYPGLVASAGLGILLEIATAWLLLPDRRSLRPAAGRVLAPLRHARPWRGFPLHSVGAALLAALAAIQLAAPYSPTPPGNRNLLTAAIALVGVAWILWTWGWSRGELDPRLMLTVQLAWLVALLVPAVIPQTLKPQTLGYVTLSPALPVKVACGILYLLCLPALLHLIPETAPQGLPGGAGRPAGAEGAGFSSLRMLLWLPYCGLFASLFFSPGSDSPLEVLRFAGIVVGAAAVTVAISVNLVFRGALFTGRFYGGVVVPFAWISLGVGLISAALDAR